VVQTEPAFASALQLQCDWYKELLALDEHEDEDLSAVSPAIYAPQVGRERNLLSRR
jgi:hypothetical protein